VEDRSREILEDPLSEVSSSEDELSRLQRLIDQASERVQDQLALIEQLALDGHDVKRAEQLLRVYLQVMGTFMERRDRLQPYHFPIVERGGKRVE
jgi:vacuolar-type H+-ATPase subunit E/Vma4